MESKGGIGAGSCIEGERFAVCDASPTIDSEYQTVAIASFTLVDDVSDRSGTRCNI